MVLGSPLADVSDSPASGAVGRSWAAYPRVHHDSNLFERALPLRAEPPICERVPLVARRAGGDQTLLGHGEKVAPEARRTRLHQLQIAAAGGQPHRRRHTHRPSGTIADRHPPDRGAVDAHEGGTAWRIAHLDAGSAAGSVGRPVTETTACLATTLRSRNSVRRLVYRSPAKAATSPGASQCCPAGSASSPSASQSRPPGSAESCGVSTSGRMVPPPNLLRPDKLGYDVGDRIAGAHPCSGQCLGDSPRPNSSRVPRRGCV